MKFTPTFVFSLLFTFAMISIGSPIFAQSSSTSTSGSSSVSASCSGGVYFGTPPETNSPCVGKGLCGDGAGGINATFAVAPNNPNTLIMIFSLSELKQKQPDQVAYFTDNSGSYMFDAAFSFSTSSLFAPLNLPANAQILPTSTSLVQISGDIVIDFIQYSVGN